MMPIPGCAVTNVKRRGACRRSSAERRMMTSGMWGKKLTHTLVGEGIIVDKLIKMVMKDGTATLGGVKYEGTTLLKIYLKKILALAGRNFSPMR